MRHNDDRSQSTDDTDPSSGVGPSDLIVASNRQPYRHDFESAADDPSNASPDAGGTDRSGVVSEQRSDVEREITVDEPTGGLTAGLDPVMKDIGGTWVAWGDGDADSLVTDDNDCVDVPPEEESYTLRRIWLSEEAVDSYYYGFSNQVLWPLCHGFTSLIEHRSSDRQWYRRVNRRFADAVTEHVSDESVVWLQDYHLALASRMIRRDVPSSVTVAQFWHVPWPSPEQLGYCPEPRELVEGLLGNDLLGFHVERYVDAFLDCVDSYVPTATVDEDRRLVRYEGRSTRVVADPMGVDARSIDDRSRSLDGSRWNRLRDEYGIPSDVSIGLGIDRLDYSKGIPERLAAIERLFERYPEWRESFTFVQKATPSRTDIPAYQWHGESVRHTVRDINERFATDDWVPIVYTEDVLPRADLDALYRRADVMIVSPLIDGMNLVAQEYVATRVDRDGALMLSERTGAHDVYGRDAYTIAPADTESFADRIDEALTAPRSERGVRMASLRRQVFDNDIQTWMSSQLDRIEAAHGETAANERGEKRTPGRPDREGTDEVARMDR